MSNIDVLNQLKEKGMDCYGSWALYGENAITSASKHGTIHIPDVEFPDDLSNDELAKKIKPQYMFVGLNVSKLVSDKNVSWHNFHYVGDTSKDGNILKIITDTDYFGGYMTDIIKDLPEREGGNALKRIAGPNRKSEDIDVLKDSLKKFNMELDVTKPKEIIIFGNDAFEVFKMAVQEGLLDISDEVKVVKTIHYSSQTDSNDSMYSRFTGEKGDIMGSGQYKWNTLDEIKKMPLDNDNYKLSWK